MSSLKDELEEEMLELATEVTRDAIAYFEKAIEREGIILTSQLRNSFEYRIITQAGRLAASAEIMFSSYGRFKDMRTLNYVMLPPIDLMEEFVEKIGLNQFAYIHGYEGKAVPTVPNAANRLAWAIAIRLKRAKIVRRPNKGWYNQTKADFVNVMRKRLLEKAQDIVAKGMATELGG